MKTAQPLQNSPAPAAERPAEISRSRLTPLPLKVSRILVPVDFSEQSLQALRLAMGLVQQLGAELILVHIVEEVFYPGEWEAAVFASMGFAKEKCDEVHRQLEGLTASFASHVRCIVRLGRAWQEVAEIAKEQKAGLIVMATHGYTGLRHALLGSVAEKVLRHAPCPVLIVRPDEETGELGMGG